MKFILRVVGAVLLLVAIVLTGGLLLSEVNWFFLDRSLTVDGQPHFYLNPMIACAVGVLFGLGQPMRFIGNAIIACVGVVVFYIAYRIWPLAFSHVWFCLPLFFFWGASCPFGLAMAYHMMLHPTGEKPLTEESVTKFLDKVGNNKIAHVAGKLGIIILATIASALLLGIAWGVWVLVTQ